MSKRESQNSSFTKAIAYSGLGLGLVILALLLSIVFPKLGSLSSTVKNITCPTTPGKPGVQGKTGLAGLSAYDLWIAQGNVGTLDEFLSSLIGKSGNDGYIGSTGIGGPAGAEGKSAYQLWLDAGNFGNPADFLAALEGDSGSAGVNGIDGVSAFDLWKLATNQPSASVDDFIAALKGESGSAGESAYEVWVAIPANAGKSVDDFINSLKGEPGTPATCTDGTDGTNGTNGIDGENGKSAYEVWLDTHTGGTVQDFIIDITGPQGPQGIQGPKGETGASGSALPYFGSFYDTTTQRNQADPNLMRFNTTDPWTNGISIVSGSRITFAHPGVYNIQFSAQFAKDAGSVDYIDVWLKKNGSNVANSDTRLRTKDNDDRLVAAWNFYVEATTVGDYFELAWDNASNDNQVYILATAANSVPGIPSVILTVTPVKLY